MYPSRQFPRSTIRFEWIGEAWQLIFARVGVWIPAVLIAGVCIAGAMAIFNFGMGLYTASPTPPVFSPSSIAAASFTLPVLLENIVTICLEAFFLTGLMRIALAQVRGEEPHVSLLFRSGNRLPAMLGLVAAVAVAYWMVWIGIFEVMAHWLGFAGAMIGGVVAWLGSSIAMGLLMPAYALVADGEPLTRALKRSVAAMAPVWGWAALLAVAVAFVAGVGIIAIGVGVLFTFPIMIIVPVLMVRDCIGLSRVAPAADTLYRPAEPGVWPRPPAPEGTLDGGDPAPEPSSE